jgi:RNA polymerase-interacting CarD/CdnL/TRCF family regulator
VGVTAANAAEELVMHFNISDVVVHPAYGIGHIVKIKEKQFSKKRAARLYYQITMPDRNTIWTPVEDQVSNGLRLVTAKSDLDQYRTLLKSRPVIPKKQRLPRYLELVSRLKQGSFQVNCEVVRDLTLSNRRKPLGITNKTILRRTQDRLYQEWATAADISVAEATKEIGSLLQATQEGALK